jgi:hypothetical protein
MIIAATRYGKAGGSKGLPTFTTNTGYAAPTLYTDLDGNWELVFLSDWSGQFGKNMDVDVFVVAGGQQADSNGGGGSDNWWSTGGAGGNGGGCVTRSLQLAKDTDYSVAIGGSGVASTAFGVTASSGAGSAGGAGANAGSNSLDPSFVNKNGDKGTDGVYAFGTADTLYQPGRKYGAGGGGGAAGVDSDQKSPGAGGETGGGAGTADDGVFHGGNGLANTGGGGGGVFRYRGKIPGGTIPGAGGSGIVIIRNARNST